MVFRKIIESFKMFWTGVVVCLLEFEKCFRSREELFKHCVKAHPGQLVADMIIRGDKVHKAIMYEKIPAMDCVICYKRAKDRSGANLSGTILRCKVNATCF